MIGYLFGKILFSDGEEVILLTESGVGYRVIYKGLLAEGGTVGVYISHVFREQSQDLFGFLSLEDTRGFEWLLKVKGVGPKSAYTLIQTLGRENLYRAIGLEDKKILLGVPGIGPKTASQIILDLKDKIPAFKGVMKTSPKVMGQGDKTNHFLQEALEACRELGLQEKDILPMARQILGSHAIQKSEELVHLILKGV